MADIEKKQLQDILLPWAQVTYVQKSATIDEVYQVALNSGHTRLPVKENGAVFGVLHTKEFISLRESGETNWQSIVRSTLILKPTDSALGAMRLLQDRKTHMAIVLSPQRQLVGLVTLEDILEEVVGDIFDEDDDGRVRKVYTAKIKARVIPSDNLLVPISNTRLITVLSG